MYEAGSRKCGDESTRVNTDSIYRIVESIKRDLAGDVQGNRKCRQVSTSRGTWNTSNVLE